MNSLLMFSILIVILYFQIYLLIIWLSMYFVYIVCNVRTVRTVGVGVGERSGAFSWKRAFGCGVAVLDVFWSPVFRLWVLVRIFIVSFCKFSNCFGLAIHRLLLMPFSYSLSIMLILLIFDYFARLFYSISTLIISTFHSPLPYFSSIAPFSKISTA